MQQQQIIIWSVIAVYMVFMAVIGYIFSRATKNKGIDEFTVGGRNAGAWVSALSFGTSYFSAVMFIGYAGKTGWGFGLWGVLVGLGNALFGTMLAWWLLADRTRRLTRKHNIKSMPQFFEARYNSSTMKIFSSIVIFIFLLPYSASVYMGLSSICSVLLQVNQFHAMIAIAAAAGVVLVLGGYMATLKADFVQGLIMFFGVVLLIIFVLRSPTVGGLSAGLSQMAEVMKNETMPLNANPFAGFVSLMALILMTSFGTWGLPHMIHKYYAIKDKQEVFRGAVISTVFAVVVAGGGYFIGSFGRLFFSTLPEGGVDFIVPNLLKNAQVPDIMLGVILVLLIAASVTTLAAITLSAASTVSMDLIKKVKPAVSDSRLTLITRILCLLFIIASFVIANTKTPILDMMAYSWGILAGSFLAPYAIALYSKKINKKSAWAGMLSGFVIASVPVTAKLLNQDWTLPFKLGKILDNGPLFACVAIVVSLAVCLVMTAVSKAEKNEEFYANAE